MARFDDNTPFAVIAAFYDGKPKACILNPSERGIAAIAIRECRIPGDRWNTLRLAISDCYRRSYVHRSQRENATAMLYDDIGRALYEAARNNVEPREFLAVAR